MQTQSTLITSSKKESAIYVAIDNIHCLTLSLSDVVKASAYCTIAALQKQGIKTVVISGDDENACALVCNQVNITTYYSATLPQGKQALIKQFQAEGEIVCMLGMASMIQQHWCKQILGFV